MLVVVTVIAVSVALVVWRARPNGAHAPVRFPGAKIVTVMPSLLPRRSSWSGRATAGDVAAWWRARADVGVTAQRDTNGVVRVSVKNHGAATVVGAVVRVVLGPEERAVRSDLRPLPAPAGIARLELPSIFPGQARTFLMTVHGPGRDQ